MGKVDATWDGVDNDRHQYKKRQHLGISPVVLVTKQIPAYKPFKMRCGKTYYVDGDASLRRLVDGDKVPAQK